MGLIVHEGLGPVDPELPGFELEGLEILLSDLYFHYPLYPFCLLCLLEPFPNIHI